MFRYLISGEIVFQERGDAVLGIILCIVTPANYGSTTIRLRTFRLRHFVYRHFHTLAFGTVLHPTYVSANHYFHQFKPLFTL